ncbi:hypothetical protein V5799_012099, partial [Amblyomma americanum]
MLDMGYEKIVVFGRRRLVRRTDRNRRRCGDRLRAQIYPCLVIRILIHHLRSTRLAWHPMTWSRSQNQMKWQLPWQVLSQVVPDMAEEAILDQVLIPTMATAETAEEMTEDELTPAVAAPEMADDRIPYEAAPAMVSGNMHMCPS